MCYLGIICKCLSTADCPNPQEQKADLLYTEMHKMFFAVRQFLHLHFFKTFIHKNLFCHCKPKIHQICISVQNGEHLHIIRFAQLLLSGGMADNLFESISIYSSETFSPWYVSNVHAISLGSLAGMDFRMVIVYELKWCCCNSKRKTPKEQCNILLSPTKTALPNHLH